jgi:alpha-1,6-mannosyltransferase
MGYERDPLKLAAMVASCDALVHANENEPFGLIVLEALASGLPVVGPSRGGIAELIDETVGQKAARADTAGMAEAIEALFAREQAPIRAAARRRAEQRHGWDNTFEGLTRLYSEMVIGPQAAPALRA